MDGSFMALADETKVGKWKYHRGRYVDGVWVLGMCETLDPKKVVLVPVPNRKKETLDAIFVKHIKKGSIIISDGWKA